MVQEVRDGTHCAYEGMVWIGLDGTQLFWGCPRGVFARRPARLNTAIAAALPQPIGLQHDGACAACEAADPLHCARIDTEAFRNDAHTWSSRNRQGLPDAFF